MQVKMLTSMAGRDFSLSPGEVTDRFSDDEAARLIKAGFCEPVVEERARPAVKRGGKTVEVAEAVVRVETRD